MPDPIVEFAPAKVNLFLHITGKRKDHYHLLESLVAFAAYGDTLELYPSPALTLDIAGPFSTTLRHATEHNLVMKAARLLHTHSGSTPGARMLLHKRLPVSSGLGGGSADAAAALRGLIRLWGMDVPPPLLQALALSLGSDVPVCLASQPALMRGVADRVSPVAWEAPAGIVLVNPALPLLTAEVFRKFSGTFSAAAEWPSRVGSVSELMAMLASTHNALEPAAIGLQPAITGVLAALRAEEGCRLARMSGSGATCFGLFDDADTARAAEKRLQKRHPSWWTIAASLDAKK